jgi:hypothetical protein
MNAPYLIEWMFFYHTGYVLDGISVVASITVMLRFDRYEASLKSAAPSLLMLVAFITLAYIR